MGVLKAIDKEEVLRGSCGTARVVCYRRMPVMQMSASPQHSIQQRLEDVLATPESSTLIAEKKAKKLCQFYQTLIPSDKSKLLVSLARDHGVDQQTVLQNANLLLSVDAQDREVATLLRTEERLRTALTPRYQQLFTHISRLDNGVKFLVDLRADLLQLLAANGVEQSNAFLQAMSTCLRNLVSLWFSVGFLQLERITWQSPCDILQKISDYEAVHPIRNWTDLRRRVGPYRRCYVFTHNSMPREPVVVLHTALTTEISDSIQAIVANNNQLSNGSGEGAAQITQADKEDASKVNTAIFYSITSTQKGLQGVELGNYLIKNAVREILSEFPHMCNFSSLSPIPGFKEWLIGEMNRAIHRRDIGEGEGLDRLFQPSELQEIRDCIGLPHKEPVLPALNKLLHNNTWLSNESLAASLKTPLMRLCARYLFLEKRRHVAMNPVANFHLRNGAEMWRVNWLADTSARGLGASCGLMVNYRYRLELTEEYSRLYTEQYLIHASSQVKQLLETPSPQTQRAESVDHVVGDNRVYSNTEGDDCPAPSGVVSRSSTEDTSSIGHPDDMIGMEDEPRSRKKSSSSTTSGNHSTRR